MRVFVHATAGAKRNQVGGAHDGALRVAVTAPADHGKANRAIVKLLAKTIGVKVHQVTLVRGHTNRRKVFEIDADVSPRVAELMKS